MRGRKPTPTPIKIMTGAAAKNPKRINKREPPQPAGEMIKPVSLGDHASREWDRIIVSLKQMGLESPIYQSALEILVEAYGDYHDSRAKALKLGIAIAQRKPDGSVAITKNQYTSEMRASLATYLQLLSEFGLTPSSKTRVSADPLKNDDAEFFGVIG